MKILKKRILAFVIDSFFLGLLLMDFLDIIARINSNVDFIDFESFFAVLFIFKDCIFINGSLGKKIMGLVVYNANWQRPSFVHSLKRTVATNFIAPFMFFKAFISFSGPDHVDKLRFFSWEKNVLNSFVIDKKVYRKLKADAEGMDGNFSYNMTELYMMYLRDIYSK